jgi:hypothetical protein
MAVYFNAPNKYACPCGLCRKNIPAGLGVDRYQLPNGKYEAYHKECKDKKREAEEAAADKAAVINLELEEDGRVSVRNTSLSTKNKFFATIRALGFFWDKDAGKSFGAFSAVPALTEALNDGYNVIIGRLLERAIDSKIKEAKSDEKEAHERADDIDVLLKKRNLSLYDFQRKTIKWLAPRHKALLALAVTPLQNSSIPDCHPKANNGLATYVGG